VAKNKKNPPGPLRREALFQPIFRRTDHFRAISRSPSSELKLREFRRNRVDPFLGTHPSAGLINTQKFATNCGFTFFSKLSFEQHLNKSCKVIGWIEKFVA